MSILYVDNTYRVNVSFTTWDDDTNTSSSKSPISITYTEYKDSVDPANILSTGTPTGSGDSYYYDYTPTATGNYFIVFDATFDNPDATPSTVTESIVHEFQVVKDGASSSKSTVFDTLIEDETIEISSGMSPMFLNPEEIQAHFAEASLLQIAELIHFASIEVLEILDTTKEDTAYTDLPYVAIEYIQASVLCSLDKIYGYDNADSVRLGDLSVNYNNNSGGSSRYVNRGSATTPCEAAAALRKELLMESTKFGSGRGPRHFTRSSRNANPMPDRTILYAGEPEKDLRELEWNRGLRSLDD